MNQENQTPVQDAVSTEAQAPQAVSLRIGFEATMDMFNPNWKTDLLPDDVNKYRFFYQSAMRDLSFFIGAANSGMTQLVESFKWMDANAATTGIPAPQAPPEAPAEEVKPKTKVVVKTKGKVETVNKKPMPKGKAMAVAVASVGKKKR